MQDPSEQTMHEAKCNLNQLTCLYQRGGNQGPESILGAETVLLASSAPSVLGEHSKSEHVAGILADPEANPPEIVQAHQ